ncbi:putative ribonuclease H-like domain-containing protein [Tanacetum coccineum]
MFLKLEVRLRDNALHEYKMNLEKAEIERDQLKQTLEKFQNSSKSLNNILESQVIDKFKTGLGYDTATAASPAVEIESNAVRMNNTSAPIIEDWNSDDEILTRSGKLSTAGIAVNTVIPVNTANIKQLILSDQLILLTQKQLILETSAILMNIKIMMVDLFPLVNGKGRKFLNKFFFTDTECLVVSSNFKLLDESQVLLRIPRKDNIYSVDVKSVVPTGGLTCLIAKAIVDESNTWHRRLGHINFKTMNKLMNGNLVKVSKSYRVFYQKDWIVKRTLNIRILKNTPNVKGNGPDWLFDVDSLLISMNYVPVATGNKTNGIAGTKDNIVAGKAQKEKEHEQDTPVSTAGPSFDTAVPSTPVNAVGPSVSTANESEEQLFERFSPFKNAFSFPPVPNISLMDNTGIFGNAYDDEDVEEEVDMNNKPVQALKDPSWVEAMQNELLQFKILNVWTLVDLPIDKWAIGTKWVFRNKKDERGIVVKNKARLVA